MNNRSRRELRGNRGFLILLAGLVVCLLIGLPTGAGAEMKFQFTPSTLDHMVAGDTEIGGVPMSTLQVNTGDSVTLHVWVTFDPAYAASAWGATDLWVNWDPTQLRLDDSYSMVPNVAATPSVPNGVPGYTEDTSQGLFVRSIDYGTFGQMTSGEVFAISFRVLGSGAALITMKSDTIPETNITGNGVWDGGGAETIGFNSYSITLSSSETDSPVITTPVIAGFIHANTQAINVIVTDSSTALGNMNFTMWVNSDSTGGVWRAIPADSYTISGTYANFSCTVPGDSIGGANLYYFFTVSDSWGNWDTDMMYLGDTATWNNNFDTTIAWVTAIATAVPFQIDQWGNAVSDSVAPNSAVAYEIRTSTLYLQITTMADTITVYSGDGADTIASVYIFNEAGENRTLMCTVPIPVPYNRFFVVAEDTFLPTYTSETYTIIGDSVAPLYGAALINNGAAAANTLSCSIYVTAADSYTISGYYLSYWDKTRELNTETFAIFAAQQQALIRTDDTFSLYFTPENVSDSGSLVVWMTAYDSSGNWDTNASFVEDIVIDTAPPVIDWQAPGDSMVRTGETLDVDLDMADSSAFTGYMVYRHLGLAGQTEWDTQTFVFQAGVTYRVSIPGDSIGAVGTNDAVYGIDFFIFLQDAFGQTTYVDSMGVDYSMTRTVAQANANPDSLTAADSVYVGVEYVTTSNQSLGLGWTAIALGDTAYINDGDTLFVRLTSNADTPVMYGLGGDYQVSDTPGVGALVMGAQHVFELGPQRSGLNYFWIGASDAVEPGRDGDTICFICDTAMPIYNFVNIDTGAVAYDSGTGFALTVFIAAADSQWVGGAVVTPDTMLVLDSCAVSDTHARALLAASGVAYNPFSTLNWSNNPDTTDYMVYVYVQDRAGNVTGTATSIAHDTYGPQVEFAGIPDQRSAAQTYTFTFDVYDTVGIGAVAVVAKHDTVGQAVWYETTAINVGGSVYQAPIDSTLIGSFQDEQEGVKYYIRTLDNLGHYTYWGVPAGVAGNPLGNFYDTFGQNDTGATGPQADFYYDTFSVVLSVPTITTVSGTNASGVDTVAMATEIYFAASTLYVTITTQYGDTVSIGNQTTGETFANDQPVDGLGTGYDTVVTLQLAKGLNVLIVDVRDTDMPNFWSTYNVYADTERPIITDGGLFGSHVDPVTGNESTDSSGLNFFLIATDTDYAMYEIRIDEDTGWGQVQVWTDTTWYGYSDQDTAINLYVFARDQAGNVSDTLPITVYHDTAGPDIMHTAPADSRAANATLNLTATLNDLSGTYAITNLLVWYNNDNQSVGSVNGWDSQAGWMTDAVNSVWSCSIPAAAIGALPDSSVAYFLESIDTWGKKAYFTASGFSDTLLLAQAQADADTFTTITAVKLEVYFRDGNDSDAGERQIYQGADVNSDTAFLRFITDADTVTFILNSDWANKWETQVLVGNYDVVNWIDTATAGYVLLPGLNTLWIRGQDYSQPESSDTFIIICDTTPPDVTLASLALFDAVMVWSVATDSTGVAVLVTAVDSYGQGGGSDTGAVAGMRFSDSWPFDATLAWSDYSVNTTVFTFSSNDTTVYYLSAQFMDTAGNVSDTLTAVILHDTAAPALSWAYTSDTGIVEDSRGANQPLTVTVTVNDLSGIDLGNIQAYLYFAHDTGAGVGWDSTPMTPTGADYTGIIPAGFIDATADSIAPYNVYAVAVGDTFGHWTYVGAKGDTSFGSLAAVQADPDSFTTVFVIGVTSSVYTALLADTQTLSDSIFINSGVVNLYLLSIDADTITIGQYTGDWGLVDTYTLTNASALGGETTTALNLVDNINVFYLIVEDSAVSPQPELRYAYAFYCDTYAPILTNNDLTIGDTVWADTAARATAETTVTVYLNITDTDNGINISDGNDSYISYYELSESDTFGWNTTGWMPYATNTSCSFTFTNALEGDTQITMYARFMDDAGNTSAYASRSFMYDTTGPVVTFAAISDSMAVSRAVPVAANVLDLICDTPAFIAVVSFHASTSAAWETWVMNPSDIPNQGYSGVIPDTVVGAAPDLSPGVLYYVATADSFNHWTFTVDSIYFATGVCTDVAYARAYADSFTVANPVAVASFLQDRQSDTYYFAADVWPSDPLDIYSSDSLTIKVVTDADSLAIYVFSSDLATRLLTIDTISLVQGATAQTYVFSLADTVIADTMFIQVYAFDYTEPVNTETYAIVCDTTSPFVWVGPWIDMFGAAIVSDTYSTGDSRVVVAVTAMDSYPWNTVAYVMITDDTTPPPSEYWARTTDAENYKYWQRYDSPLYYTFAQGTPVTRIQVVVSDSAGNTWTLVDTIRFDTQAPEVFLTSFTDSKSTNQQVGVQPLINDLSGTTAVSANLYYRHSPDTAAWASSAMVAQIDGTFLGFIPASVTGVDTTNLVEFVIETFDIFGHTQYVGRNGDTSFATLAAAEAAADTFGLVEPIATTVQLWDANDTGLQYIDYSGLVFNAVPLNLVISTAADTVQVIVSNRSATGLAGADSYAYHDGALGLAGDTFAIDTQVDTVPLFPFIDVDGCTWVIRVIASDTDGGGVQFDNSWTIVIDTGTPLNGKATVSDTAWGSIVNVAATNLTFNAYDSYGIDVVGFWGDVTSNTVAFTGAATAVTLAAGEGWKSVYHQYLDVAGNLSAVFGDSFYLDVTAGTITLSPAVLTTAVSTYTCTGTVLDNYVDTPAWVYLKITTDTGTALADSIAYVTDAYPAAIFSSPLELLKGMNTITATVADTAGHTTSTTLLVSFVDAAFAGTSAAATISDTWGGSLAVDLGTGDSTVISITNATGTETVTFTIDFTLPGYVITVERFDDTALAINGTLYGMIPADVGSDRWDYTDSFIFRITAVDSLGVAVGENAGPYDSVTVTWTYSVPAEFEDNLHVYYSPALGTAFTRATDVAGLVPAGQSELQDRVLKTIALRVTHLSIWGIFAGGAPVMANLDNVVIFPNPFKPYDGNAANGVPYSGNPNDASGIHFMNLASGTEIKIYTVNGELVDSIEMVANQGLAVWDGYNKGNEECASGIYIVVFRANGQTVVKKLAIIR